MNNNQGLMMPIDQYITITLSDDKLAAYLQFSQADERFQCSMEQLGELVKAHFIQHGVQYDTLAQIAREPRSFFYNRVTIAVGDAPLDGENGYIHFQYDLDSDSKKPAEMEDGSVDYKEVIKLNNVRKGQLIAELIPAQEGVNGKAVTGETLFAKTGKDARFKIGRNVVVDSEKTKLYAAIDGLVTKTDKEKVNVFPIYEVNGDVDYNVGNIDFIGTVVIRGSVLNGFKIKASGDIRVIGGVEGAELEAEGSVEIGAGILGHNKGLIKAGKNVKSSFIQEGNVEAGENIVVSQSIMHSHVQAGKNVLCSGNKGLIVGGVIQAGEKIAARTIGNTMSTATVIEVGVLPQLRNELIHLRNQLKGLAENMDKSEKALTLLDQLASVGQLSQDKLAMRIKLNNTKRQSIEEQAEIKDRILEIEKSLEDTNDAVVEVISTVYGGTKIVIGRYTRFIKDSIQRVRFIMQDDDIAMLPNR